MSMHEAWTGVGGNGQGLKGDAISLWGGCKGLAGVVPVLRELQRFQHDPSPGSTGSLPST